ncbi:ParB N-terminal domain-containing protein [Staphylococcus aureus]|uniref:ParB N-terminal domain-containing protein n=1 Tax=Staphylococcus aureus TaxID=1280 RepID=UPI00292A52DB|nr:ParB N-terminal domain-containing protein [Staphylococcus aureus]
MYIDFLEIENLYLHELTEDQRLKKLKYKVIKEEKQRNPIIVTKYNRGYLVLDGAHRYTALKEIGCQYVMCQVIEKGDYTIEMWNHQISHNDFFKINPKTEILSIDMDSIECIIKNQCLKVNINNYEEDSIVLNMYKSLVSKINNCESFKRVLDREEDPYNKVIIKYPTLTIDTIKKIVSRGDTIPAGISRVNLKCGRVLSVNIPLEILNDTKKHKSARKSIEMNLRKYEDLILMYEGDEIYE